MTNIDIQNKTLRPVCKLIRKNGFCMTTLKEENHGLINH